MNRHTFQLFIFILDICHIDHIARANSSHIFQGLCRPATTLYTSRSQSVSPRRTSVLICLSCARTDPSTAELVGSFRSQCSEGSYTLGHTHRINRKRQWHSQRHLFIHDYQLYSVLRRASCVDFILLCSFVPVLDGLLPRILGGRLYVYVYP